MSTSEEWDIGDLERMCGMAAEFLVGYGSMDESVQKPLGNVTFVIVDDYTSLEIASEVRSRVVKEDGVRILHIMHPQAYGGLIYNKAGVVCPEFALLPVVFCIEHGKNVGTYITNATAEQAIEFIATQSASRRMEAQRHGHQ